MSANVPPPGGYHFGNFPGLGRPDRRGPRHSPRPIAPADPAAYVLPLGRHKGKTIAEVDRLDRGWLHWAAETLDGRAGEMVRAYRTARLAAEAAAQGEPRVDQDDSIPAPY